MEGEMIKAGAAAVKWHIKKSRLGLDQHDVGLAQFPTAALVPRLVDAVPEFLKQPTPEFDRPGKIGDVDFDMVKQAGSHREKV